MEKQEKKTYRVWEEFLNASKKETHSFVVKLKKQGKTKIRITEHNFITTVSWEEEEA